MAQARLPPDWTLVQSFLAVAEAGSLSAAAQALGRSQPTLGRHVRGLEAALDTRLFDRHPRGLTLTVAGAELRPMAEQMRAALQALSLAAAGRDSALAGSVRLTASLFLSHYVLPPILARIRRAEPAIAIDLVPSDASENLLFRRADIAVRMYRPTQLDLVTRHLCDTPMGVFAAHTYLARAGRPRRAENLFDHDLVGFDQNDLILRHMRAMGFPASRDAFALRCDNQATYWELVRAGGGIGFTQAAVGRADPAVEELALGLDLPRLPIWLAAHEVMRATPRIRRVWDLLAEGLQDALAG